MPLIERLSVDLISAMKAKNELLISVLRLLRAEIKNRELNSGIILSDEEIISVIQSQIKRRKEAAQAFHDGKREDLASKEEAEARLLAQYLPEQISPEELEALIDEAIREVGAGSPSHLGQVMKALMPKVRGRAEGKTVNEIVRKKLETT